MPRDNPYAKPPPGFQQTNATSSFSQSFASIETSVHYSPGQSGTVREPAPELDAHAQRMADREHHAVMQPHLLYVSTKQRGNHVLDYIKNVPFAYSPMVPDYILSSTRCALFLSCKYHARFPQYINRRISELKTDFSLRILLVLVDVEDAASTLLSLNTLAVTNNMTLLLAWSEEEAARYLETFKAFDGKDASLIQRKEQTNHVDQVGEFLTGCKGVNKTDAGLLVGQFRTLRSVMTASMDEMALVPGMGEVKVKRLHDALHKPFSTAASKKRKQKNTERKDESEAGGLKEACATDASN
jgi:DNA excision repair protein ERCC-1